jgi:hypothetical protein
MKCDTAGTSSPLNETIGVMSAKPNNSEQNNYCARNV